MAIQVRLLKIVPIGIWVIGIHLELVFCYLEIRIEYPVRLPEPLPSKACGILYVYPSHYQVSPFGCLLEPIEKQFHT